VIVIRTLSRRELLMFGAAGFAGLVSQLGFAQGEPPAPAAVPTRQRATSCIVLWMNGGPSHLDTFDPKPGRKSCGPAKAIKTKADNIQISEHLPLLAAHMDKVALLRGVSSKEGNHQRAQELAHTGRVPNPTVQAPSIGSWILKRTKVPALDIPAFVSLGGVSADAGFFGSAYDPFVVASPGQLPDDLAPARPITATRDASRRELLDSMDRDFATRTNDAHVRARQELYKRARTMMASSAVKAFDASSEPEAARAAYGDSAFGRGCLVARRLVEVGVPFVEVTLDGWDTHQNVFERTAKQMGMLDPGMSALLSDLQARGLLQKTLVVCMGEFGRTPRINGDEGRDHHPGAFSVAMAGAGVRGGIAHGSTDADGEKVVNGNVSVPDVVATMASIMGLDPTTVEVTPAGRPIYVTEGGKPIAGVMA
jgi:hypothetical protein